MQFFLPVADCTQDYVNREIWKQQILYISLKYMHIEYLTVGSMDRRKGLSVRFKHYLSYQGKKTKYYGWNTSPVSYGTARSTTPVLFLFFIRYSDARKLLRKCLFASNNLAFLKIRQRSLLCTCMDESLFRPNIVLLTIPQQQSTDNMLGLMLS